MLTLEEACTSWEKLTPTEKAVVNLLADGHTPEQASQIRFVSLATTRSQIKNVLWKFELTSYIQVIAAVWLMRCDNLLRQQFEELTYLEEVS